MAQSNHKPHRYHIIVVDDHPVVRAGIAAILSLEPDLALCAEAGSEQEALKMPLPCIPDLAIIDLSLTNSSGFSLFRELLNRYPKLRILVLSMHDEVVYAPKVLQAGAHGYLMKQEATATLVEAIHTLLRDDLFVSNRLRTVLLKGLATGAAPMETPGKITGLSKSELIVLQLIGMGHTNREIATSLHRSIKTINAHCANIQCKLGLSSRHALRQYALQWVQPPPPALHPGAEPLLSQGP